MSETVKLVIEIPSEVYEHIKGHTDNWIDFMFLSRDGKAISAVKHGTPLDEIKAKIETNLSWEMFDEYGNETTLHKELWEILDNIGKGGEE